MKRLIYFIIICLLIIPMNIKAQNKDVAIHLFYKSDCPHCHELIKYLDTYLADKDYITLYKYELNSSADNVNLFYKAQKSIGDEVNSVPYLVVGNESLVGYSKYSTGDNINELVTYYQNNPYKDVLGEAFGTVKKTDIEIIKGGYQKSYKIPFLGKINPKSASLFLTAMVIGLVDGFNPCAMWILIFLITMLFNMKDRKKMWFLGVTFLLTSAIVYALFMISWLGVASAVSGIGIIKIIIGAFAVLFGTYNIYKFITTKDVGCEVVDNSSRKKIISRIQKITNQKTFILAVLGVMLLAASVNLIEVTCSLGLPIIFTEILKINHLSGLKYATYIFIYILFFLLDDLIIFIIAMKTLKIKAISNKYAKYSHLIGGIIMLLIGLLMIFKYEWLTFAF